ncbi:hypothetical protein ABFU82_04340 [Nocardioides sp. WV_118_6]|uniref:hypothetical protein n=1 Tax=Nocardioides simplex TaxID=2045 RepID=UPI00214F7DCF|nr:hypothetical protein [Pimelobacter simplex]UUW87580.1 hypothetical protein M0M43_17740 [Pimelobacter simplex]UUW97086.1 hypothetical protein M0M48_06390 [Pimelobacter simplex]
MTAAARSWSVGAALLVLLAGLLAMVGAPDARADVRGDLVLVGEKPRVGTIDLAYRNYSERIEHCVYTRPRATTPRAKDVDCTWKGYKVARGTLKVRLRTYRLREDIRDDYYVLDVDIANAGAYGGSVKGWFKLHVDNVGATRILEHSDTKAISSRKASCDTLQLSIGQSLGPVSASMNWGTVRFCGKSAKYAIDARKGKKTVWMSTHLRATSHLSSQRIVKVPRGKKPVFEIGIHVPTDKCTQRRGSDACFGYANGTLFKSYRIGTTGG